MLYEETLFRRIDKIAIAIDRMREFCPPEGYYLAFSGGKDSMVIKYLADKAGVLYDAHFNMTTVDPPEVIKFIRKYYPDVERHRPEESMWQMIIRNGVPPTRRMRYCCAMLKESNGTNRIVLTGIRWEESRARSKRSMVEVCLQDSSKRYIHPIIDWTSEDVWELIKLNRLPYCSLYDEGFTRIGCVLCPMDSKRKDKINRFYSFYKAYLRTFDRMLKVREQNNKETTWKNAQEVMDWWFADAKGKSYSEGQSLFNIFE